MQFSFGFSIFSNFFLNEHVLQHTKQKIINKNGYSFFLCKMEIKT